MYIRRKFWLPNWYLEIMLKIESGCANRTMSITNSQWFNVVRARRRLIRTYSCVAHTHFFVTVAQSHTHKHDAHKRTLLGRPNLMHTLYYTYIIRTKKRWTPESAILCVNKYNCVIRLMCVSHTHTVNANKCKAEVDSNSSIAVCVYVYFANVRTWKQLTERVHTFELESIPIDQYIGAHVLLIYIRIHSTRHASIQHYGVSSATI